ncbi:MAG: hypothetical protein HY244_12540 [Rhizobiales bacterium]|nr:hypothetical protein [Hyphomicrobiales bacterium]
MDDLSRIHAYIEKDNPAAASRVVTRLIDRALQIGQAPYQGAKSTNPTVVSWLCRASAISYFTPLKPERFISTISVTPRGGGLGTWTELVLRGTAPCAIWVTLIPRRR